MTISERIIQLREESKKTQKEVAEYLGTNIQTYQRYEYGTREPKIQVIKKLSTLYNVTTDYILEMTNKRH